MKKYMIGFALLLTACNNNAVDERVNRERVIDRMAREYAQSQGCDGYIHAEAGCIPLDRGSSSSASAQLPPASSSSSSEAPAPLTEVVLVDQSYTHVADKTGRDRLRAMGTKLIRGTLEEAHLTFELDRGTNENSFSAVAMYVLPYNDGIAQPQLEWKRFRFVDAKFIGNCKRNLSPESNFTTLGTQAVRGTYDLAAFPTTPEDPCSTEVLTHDFVNAFNGTDPDVDFAFGFMPSDLNGHLKVTLTYRGDIEISDF